MFQGISCLDTRYYNDVKPLVDFCDEYAYYRNRIMVELKYFSRLTNIPIRYNPISDFTYIDYETILANESILKHDVKAIEYFIKELPEIKATNKAHLIHIGLTSQDVCSLGFVLCFSDGLHIIQSHIEVLTSVLYDFMMMSNADIYMLGLTHGQPATPTNFRKEIQIYYDRFMNIQSNIKHSLETAGLSVKFGGATGEFNAMKLVLPDIDWIKWCDEFINSFSTSRTVIYRSYYTNQCDNYDSIIAFLYILKMFLHILEHLRSNIWLYIQRDYLIQKTIKQEIGSSTMPHKINPIDIENAKTAIEMAKRMIDGICDILTETSFQRDISDSSALRNISSVMGYILIAINKVTNGIRRLDINVEKIQKELVDHPEVILEGIQTYLKYHCNMHDAYEIIKAHSRGIKNITLEHIHNIIISLDILDEHKKILCNLTPTTYTGIFEKNI